MRPPALLLVATVALGAFGIVVFVTPRAAADPLTGANGDLPQVCGRTGSGASAGPFTDLTAAAASPRVAADDLAVAQSSLPADPGNDLFLGTKAPVGRYAFQMGTAGSTGGHVAWRYWNGTEWRQVLVQDPSNQFTNIQNGNPFSVTFRVPTDWALSSLGDACTGSFYIMWVATTTNYAVTPKASQVSAALFNVAFKVESERGEPVTGLDAGSFTATAGDSGAEILAWRQAAPGRHELAFAPGDGYHVKASLDGFVESAPVPTGPVTTQLLDLTAYPIRLQYAVRVIVSDETPAAGPVANATVRILGPPDVECLSGEPGQYYCRVRLDNPATTVNVVRDGFVAKTVPDSFTRRSYHSDPQRNVTVSHLAYAYKAVVKDETNASIPGGEARTGDAYGVVCAPDNQTGTYYCAVPVNDTGHGLLFSRQGFVSYEATFPTHRGNQSSPAVAGLLTDIKYAYRLDLRQADGAAIRGATVHSGDAFSIACLEASTPDGNYYCPIPLNHTGFDLRIQKAGYSPPEGVSFNIHRVAAYDPQTIVTVTGNAFSVTQDESSPPQVQLTAAPGRDGPARGLVRVSGGVEAGASGTPVTRVEFQVDREAWRQANGTTPWSFDVDTTRLSNGAHVIRIRAYAGNVVSQQQEYSMNVENDATAFRPPSPGAGQRFLDSIVWWFVGGGLVVLALILAVVAVDRMRSRWR